MKIDEACFSLWRTKKGGFTRAQLSLLGVDWPPTRGWKASLIGTEITSELHEKILIAKAAQNR